MNEQTDATTWQVASQQEGSGQNDQGAYVHGVTVTFTTAKGITGTVFVPDAIYNADTVRARIQARVNAMHDVHALQG